mmetsp:Transcript_111153/g.313639  ORF Transcript_111153/g.313639 Transcript_111153/m.313639 type:complete len:291 (-) Transcript_111153:1049-1921(-)
MKCFAFKTSACLFSALACCTFFKSSTEYETTPSTSPQSAAMLRGTEISISINFLSRSVRSALLMMGSSLAVAAKTTSLAPVTSHILSIVATFAREPPRLANSSRRASALSADLLTNVTRMSGCLLNKAMSKSLPIFPAPRMQTCKSLARFRRSAIDLIISSSTAALETETDPLPIFVLVLTSFPVLIAAFIILVIVLPPEPATIATLLGSAFCMQCSLQAFIWARIWASPSTSESRPELTSKRWLMAFSPECAKRYGCKFTWRPAPDTFWRRKDWTHWMAAYLLSDGEAK